jgi:hypothetical protein
MKTCIDNKLRERRTWVRREDSGFADVEEERSGLEVQLMLLPLSISLSLITCNIASKEIVAGLIDISSYIWRA